MDLLTGWRCAVERFPEAEALVDAETGRRWTYASWGERVLRAADGLRRLGLAQGDRLGIVLKNREEHATAFWAAQQLGVAAVPVNFRWQADEVGYCLRDAGARAVLFEPATRAAVEGARLAGLDRIYCAGAGAGESAPPQGAIAFEELVAGGEPSTGGPTRRDGGEMALMLYTSGTTGRPKGVPRSHGAEAAASEAHIMQCRYARGERTLGVMPLYHTMGVRKLESIAFLNGLYVAVPDYRPAEALELIGRERLTALYLVPTIFYDLVSAHDAGRSAGTGAGGPRPYPSVRRLAFAGAAMTGALQRRCEELFAPEVFVNHLGSTEVYTFTTCDWIDRKPTCAGRAGLHSRVRVVRADPEPTAGPDDRVPQGEVGEVIVSLESPEAFAGYWNRPDADARAIRRGWYFTGDMGYLDPDGDLFVVGRVDDMVISGGENIHPIEVEEVLARHPAVAEVAVVGLPDDRWGQAVTAFVVPCAGTAPTADELDAFCLADASLARFKRPRRYEFVPEIPKSPVGKILRRKLREG